MDDARAALYLYHKHRKVRCSPLLLHAALAWLKLMSEKPVSTPRSEGCDQNKCRTGSCTYSRGQSAN